MQTNIKTCILLVAVNLLIASCENSSHEEAAEEHADEVHFSEQQFESLGMRTDTLPMRNIRFYVEANGYLEVPPQNEAAVTAMIGANVISINVIEGDKVMKGQALAYLSHPDLIKLQTDYINSWHQLQYLEQEYQRQKNLYGEKIGSGKVFQKTQADYQSMKGMTKGYESQLELMGLNLERVRQSDLYEQVPVSSPIDGHIRIINVKMGQYVQPQTNMFEIVDISHIHADFMVFEKDMNKVKEGQTVKFSIESLPGKELEATIFSVGKAFDQDPKAIHLHAEIQNKERALIQGMYIRGRILTDDVQSYALPEAGVVKEGDKYFIFTADMGNDNGRTEWVFEPVEVIIGTRDNDWVEIKLLEPWENEAKVAWNNAYYLLAEMKKGETGHDH